MHSAATIGGLLAVYFPFVPALLSGVANFVHVFDGGFVDEGLEAAAETLADRREFRLDTKHYEAFLAALDAPVKPRPRLQKLLTTRSALE